MTALSKLTLAIAVLALAACDSPNHPEATAPGYTFSYSQTANGHLDAILGSPDSEGDESSDYMSRDMDITGEVETASSFEEAAQRAWAIADGASTPEARAVLRETAALYLLGHWGQRVTPDEWQGIAQAVEVLAEVESPEAELFADGLAVIGDRWPADRRLAVARAALAGVDASGLARCMLCQDVENEAPENPVLREGWAEREAQWEAETARRDAAVQQLEQIAG